MAVRGNSEVFLTYLKLIVDYVCDRSLDTNPALINLSLCIVKVSMG